MLSLRLPLVAGVAAALLAPAAVVLAAPVGVLPPQPPRPGQQVGSAASATVSPPVASSAAPAPAPSASGSAAPAHRAAAPRRAAPVRGAAPARPSAYPYPYPPPGYPRTGYPPSGYPPPYGYPPPGYGYPPPGYGYPPPGYSYPSPGYEAAPKPPPLPKRPPHDAASRSPFFDGQTALLMESKRFQSPLTLGIEAGVFIADRLRLSARVMTALSTPNDTYSGSGSLGAGYTPQPSNPISIIYGGSAGYAVISDPGFVLSPGLLFLRSDVSAYGSFLAADVPFEWVSRSGFRIGFEVALGEAFGGTVIEQCLTYNTISNCAQGTKNEISRDGGAGFYASFVIGWGIK